jgi:hypothetical protein
MTGDKTDNHNPAAKLALRRHFLKRYHAGEPLHVMDCCQGSGLLWAELRKEFPVAAYWGMDLKEKAGRLKLDSTRVLAQPGWPQTVIDVDTYGSPWQHWEAMLPNVARPLTVFLTIGQRVTGTVGAVSKHALRAAGLTFKTKLPAGFHPKLAAMLLPYCLARAGDFGLRVVEAAEADSNNPNVRYVGVRLSPCGAGRAA